MKMNKEIRELREEIDSIKAKLTARVEALKSAVLRSAGIDEIAMPGVPPVAGTMATRPTRPARKSGGKWKPGGRGRPPKAVVEARKKAERAAKSKPKAAAKAKITKPTKPAAGLARKLAKNKPTLHAAPKRSHHAKPKPNGVATPAAAAAPVEVDFKKAEAEA